MEFALSPEQVELAATIRAVLDKHADSAAVRTAMTSAQGFDRHLWQVLCEQVGAAALAIPEEYDGFGATFFETAVTLEQIGRSLAPTPLLAGVVATEALLAGGTEDAKQRLLPRIAAGEIATIAWDDQPVLDADRATILLAVVGDDLIELDPATVQPRWVESMDQTIRLGTLDGIDSSGGARVGDGVAARARAELVGAAAGAALAVGLCDRAVAMTVSYSKEREQFGRPIGSFQALKHRMAEMLTRLELARSASWAASQSLTDPNAEDPAFLVHAAASYAGDAARHIAGETVQLHGGIAITWEHDAHLVLKRAHALGTLYGAPHVHRAAVAL